MGVTKIRSVSAKRSRSKIGWPFTNFLFRLPILSLPKKIFDSRNRSRWPLLLALLFLLIAIPAAFYFNSRTKTVEAAWWNDSWHYRQKILINKNQVSGSENLDNFVVLISLTDIHLTKAQTNGEDLVFTDNNSQQIPHEIESYDDATGTLLAWVKVPELRKDVNTPVYLYYGNTTASDQQNSASVWADYSLVYHLAESAGTTGAGSVIDSTGNTSGTPTTGIVFGETGKIGPATNFSAGTGISLGALSSPLLTAETTISFWMNTINFSSPARQNPFDHSFGGWGTMTLETSGVISYFFGSHGGNSSPYGSHQSLSSIGNTNDVWTLVSVARDPATNTFTWYKNGALLNQGSYNSTYPVIQSQTLTIGDGYEDPLNGLLDEFRVATVARSADWLATEYANQNDPATFITPGAEQEKIGPLASWSFDEGQGQTANDQSVGGFNVTLGSTGSTDSNDPTWKNPENCISGKCLEFDGTDDYMHSADMGSVPSAISYVVWFKTYQDTSAIASIRDSASVSSSYHHPLFFTLDGNLYGCVWNLGGIDMGSVEKHQWNQAVAVYESNTVNYYLNGQLAATDTTGSRSPPSSHFLSFGGSDSQGCGVAGYTTAYFKGSIDNSAIYPYALTADQIKQQYNLGRAVNLGTGTSTSLTNGLVGHWSMDEKSGTVIADISGNKNNGALNNAQETGTSDASGSSSTTLIDSDGSLSSIDNAYSGMIMRIPTACGSISAGSERDISSYSAASKTFSFDIPWQASPDSCAYEIRHQAIGKFGNGLAFDGDSDYVEIPHSASLAPKNITLSAWIDTDTVSGSSWIIDKDYWNGYSLFRSGDDIGFYGHIGSGGHNWVTNTNQISTSKGWQHVVYTFDGTTENIYIDGTLQGTQNTSGSIAADGNDLRIGVRRTGSEAGTYFNGGIDDVRIYNRALTQEEISQLFQWSPKPVAHWKFDDGQGTVATNEYSGGTNGILGTDSANPSWVAGKYGQALNFDGDDSVTLSRYSQITPIQATWEAWVKLDSLVGTQAIFNNYRTSGLEYIFGYNGSRFFIQSLEKGGNYGTETSLIASNTPVVSGTWYHVAATHDGSTIKIYVNGKLDNSTSATASLYTDIVTSGYLAIGSRYNITQYLFNGTIDDFRIYDYARTPQQIVQDMNAGHPVGGSPVGSQLAYWKLDEANGTTANNDIAGGASAALTGTGWKTQQDCKRGSCLAIDNDDLAIADLDYNNTGTYTLSAFIYPTSVSGIKHIMGTDVGNNLNDGLIISGGNLCFHEYSTQSLDVNKCTSNTPVQINTWQHVALTYDQGAIALYLDGNQVHTDSYVTSNSSTKTLIGSNFSRLSSRTFSGYIDEVKIYSSALSAEQIKTDLNLGVSANYGTNANEASSLADGAGAAPILEYNFDEMTGTPKDTSGLSQPTAINNATWYATGKSGAALKFNGTDSNVTTTHNSNLTFDTGDFTMSLWMKPNGEMDGNDGVISKSPCLNHSCQTNALAHAYGELRWLVNNSTGLWTNYVSLGSIGTFTDIWSHITLVREDDQLRGYVNGGLVGTKDLEAGFNFSNTANLLIGSAPGVGTPFKGIIDQVRIYNYARTPSQIAYDYNRGAPVAHWKLDECQGATAYDTSGSNLHGTISSAASIGTCSSSAGDMWADGANGKYAASLDFDNNASDAVTLPNSEALKTTDEMSVCAWIKTPSTSASHGIFEKTVGGAVNTGYLLFLEGANYKFRIKTNSLRTVTSVTTLTENQNAWTHLCGTFNKSAGGVLSLFVNGKLDNSATHNENMLTGDGESYIGKLGGNIYPMNGQIDDVRIYNYALSLDQVAKVYNQGSSIRFGD